MPRPNEAPDHAYYTSLAGQVEVRTRAQAMTDWAADSSVGPAAILFCSEGLSQIQSWNLSVEEKCRSDRAADLSEGDLRALRSIFLSSVSERKIRRTLLHLRLARKEGQMPRCHRKTSNHSTGKPFRKNSNRRHTQSCAVLTYVLHSDCARKRFCDKYITGLLYHFGTIISIRECVNDNYEA